MSRNEIDFVILWVDGNDPSWQKKKAAYLSDGDDRMIRYRDWGMLKYWFRGVEKFAPWVHRVYLITDDQCPQWLNLQHPKLRLVSHTDFIPKEYLPTFSANPIEMNLHRIQDLASQFVYFNDDMFLTRKVKPTDFFKAGQPVDDAILSPVIVTKWNDIGRIVVNDMSIINKHFSFHTTVRKKPGNWFSFRYGSKLLRTLCLICWRHFPGFLNDHLPQPMLKETLYMLWRTEPKHMHETCSHRFRNYGEDVNQWLIRYWQFATNQFVPGSPFRGKDLPIGRTSTLEIIKRQKYKMICINDDERITEFQKTKLQLQNAFEQILGQKSSYEKQEE